MILLRRRLVRLHLVDPFPSIEGILVGSFDSHYRLLKPVVLEGERQSRELQPGSEAFVPRERVIFVQRLSS